MNQPLAFVHPSAKIAENVIIEPFAYIEKNVEIGEGTWIGPHTTILEGAKIGKNCKIFPGAVIAAIPQDLKFKGEKTTAEIGDNTMIRECVTISRGTLAKGRTIIGSNCLIMAYCHVAHDCVVGNIQDRTGGFYSFVAWTFQPQTKEFPIRDVSPEEYLRTVALCRLVLDNVDHVEVSLLGMGPELGMRALRGGGDDVNSVVLEENVLKSRAPTTVAGMEELLRSEGFVPRFRAFDFSDMERPAGAP